FDTQVLADRLRRIRRRVGAAQAGAVVVVVERPLEQRVAGELAAGQVPGGEAVVVVAVIGDEDEGVLDLQVEAGARLVGIPPPARLGREGARQRRREGQRACQQE